MRRLLFLNFYVVYRLDRWLKLRFTQLGALLAGTFLVASVFGINTRATLSYQVAALCLAAIGIAIVAAPLFRARIDAVRRLPRYGTVGEPLRYTVVLTNRGRGTERGLLALEELDVATPDVREFSRAREPADRRRNWFDRNVGYPRWAALMRRRRGAGVEATPLPDLPPGRPVAVAMRLTPLRRGYVRLDRLSILRPDPLGLFNARIAVERRDSLLVLPRRYPVSWVELSGSTRDRTGGSTRATATGGSNEFASLREYRPGDPIRHIHWKGWARHGMPIVKEFHEESHSRQALVLDTHLRADGTHLHFEGAVSAAASFAYAAPSGRGVLELLFTGTGVHRVSSGPGIGSTDRLLEALACVDVSPQASFAATREAVWASAGELSGCICVLLDWDEERRALVRALDVLSVPLLVLVITDPSRPLAKPDPGPMAAHPERFHVIPADRIGEGLAALGAGAGARPWRAA